MSTAKYRWEDVRREEIAAGIARKMVWAEQLMIAQIFVDKGAVVPAHEHDNEQGTYIISGALRFWLGEHADNPGDEYVDVHAGEVLMIPGGVRHRAQALEDSMNLDVFNPPRQDWINQSDANIRAER